MSLSTKSDYGLRALVELAHHANDGRPTRSMEIAARQHIPESYLEQLLVVLRRAGFIRSIRGRRGGHLLAVDPARLKVSEVVEALDGPITPISCLDETSACSRMGGCIQRSIWEDVRQAVINVLAKVSVADLAARDRAAQQGGGRYAI